MQPVSSIAAWVRQFTAMSLVRIALQVQLVWDEMGREEKELGNYDNMHTFAFRTETGDHDMI